MLMFNSVLKLLTLAFLSIGWCALSSDAFGAAASSTMTLASTIGLNKVQSTPTTIPRVKDRRTVEPNEKDSSGVSDFHGSVATSC